MGLNKRRLSDRFYSGRNFDFRKVATGECETSDRGHAARDRDVFHAATGEYVGVNDVDPVRDREFRDFITTGKCTVSDRFYPGRNFNIFKVVAIEERVRSNGDQSVRKGYGSEVRACIEKSFADRGYVVRYHDLRDPGVAERCFADRGDAVRQGNRFEFPAVKKHVRTDRLNAFGNFDFAQPVTPSERIVSDRTDAARDFDRFQVVAIEKHIVADIRESVAKGHACKRACIECGFPDGNDTTRQGDFAEIGTPGKRSCADVLYPFADKNGVRIAPDERFVVDSFYGETVDDGRDNDRVSVITGRSDIDFSVFGSVAEPEVVALGVDAKPVDRCVCRVAEIIEQIPAGWIPIPPVEIKIAVRIRGEVLRFLCLFKHKILFFICINRSLIFAVDIYFYLHRALRVVNEGFRSFRAAETGIVKCAFFGIGCGRT